MPYGMPNRSGGWGAEPRHQVTGGSGPRHNPTGGSGGGGCDPDCGGGNFGGCPNGEMAGPLTSAETVGYCPLPNALWACTVNPQPGTGS